MRAAQSRVYWPAVVLVVLLGLGLRSGALRGVPIADDWDHYAMLRGVYPVPRAAWDLYNFVADSDTQREVLRNAGRLPWWSAPQIHLAMFRPLSSELLRLDHAALCSAARPELAHWHTFAWWVVLVAGAAVLFRRLMPPMAALFGLLIFAADDAHTYAVAWLANRAELVALALAVWSIHCHLQAVRARNTARAIAAWILMSLALLAGEYALAALPMLFMLDLSRPAATGPRLRSLMPFVVEAALYILVRRALGYGVAGSEYYIDPVAEPARYTVAVLARMPLLLGDLLFGVPAEWGLWGSPLREGLTTLPATAEHAQHYEHALLLGCGVFAAAVSLAFVRWLLRTRARSVSPALGFMLIGAFASLPLMCGTAPMNRLTLAPALAFDASLGFALWWCLKSARARHATPGRRSIAVVGAVLIALVHLVKPALASFDGSQALAAESRVELAWIRSSALAAPEPDHTQAFVVSARDMASQFCLPYVQHYLGRAQPRSSQLLSPSSSARHVLTRPSVDVLELEIDDAGASEWPFGPAVYRRADLPFHVGQTFRLDAFDVTISAMRGDLPTRLRFQFRSALDDPHLLFLYPTAHGMDRLDIPPVNGRLELEAAAAPH